MSRCGALTKRHCSESAGQAEPESALGPKKTEEQLRGREGGTEKNRESFEGLTLTL